ncbi:MAG: phospholipase D-like domain-containing protein, partial [Burkholderiaceae bacterium]|nr:phospholipase D-like domain-containing protein [Burkholderiaceae bacterium]
MIKTAHLLWALAGLSSVAALLAAGHAVIYKRDPRSATLWVLLIALLPALGPLLYVLFGINRTQRRAQRLRSESAALPPLQTDAAVQLPESWRGFAHLVGRLTCLPLTAGNRITALVGGADAYPAMLQAIDSARHSVALATYIFDGQGIGECFVAALARAQARGVQVRVLIDDVHVRLSRGSAYRALVHAGVPVASFNATVIPARLHAMNLRNHRKILVVDGALGFTGGMNVQRPYFRPDAPAQALRDLHFRVEGPVVAQLRQTFARDWADTTNEALEAAFWGAEPAPLAAGAALARCIEAGPDETVDRLRWTFLGALATARERVCIWTPYFLPDQALVAALSAAALRGVA